MYQAKGGYLLLVPQLNSDLYCKPQRLWHSNDGATAMMGEHQGIAQKGVRAIEAGKPQLGMAKVLPNPMFALPGCLQIISVNTLFCVMLFGGGWLK